jgi:quinol monooxygenase YgiN
VSVTYVIRFRVIPEKLGVFLNLLNGVLDAMRTEPNFHEAILHRDPEYSHHLLLYETWESHEDVLSVQLQRPYRQAWHDALPGLLREPRDITIWQAVRADQKRHSRAMSESSAPG